MKIFNINFADLAFHRDLRCGVSLIEYRNVVNQLVSSKFPVTKIGDMISLEYGKGLTDEDRNGGEFPVIGSNGIVGYHDEYIVEGPCIVVGRKGSAGEITYLEEPCYPIDTTFYVQPKTDFFNIKFLAYVLRLLRFQKLALHKGVPGLNRFDAYEVNIPMVPQAIQKVVLEKIEPIEHKIKKLHSEIKEPIEAINLVFARKFGYDENLWFEFGKGMTAGTQKSKIKKSNSFSLKFQDFAKSNSFRFSARFHNPLTQKLHETLQSFPTIKVKQVLLESVHRGKQPIASENGTVYAIKTGQLKNNIIDLESCEFVNEDFFEKNPNAQTKNGDVLLASTGKVSLGKIDLTDFDDDFQAVVDGHVSILRINENLYNKQFFVFYFRSILGAFQIERDFTGATNQIELTASEIEKFDIPNISLELQYEIVAEVKAEFSIQHKINQQIEVKLNEIEEIIKQILN